MRHVLAMLTALMLLTVVGTGLAAADPLVCQPIEHNDPDISEKVCVPDPCDQVTCGVPDPCDVLDCDDPLIHEHPGMICFHMPDGAHPCLY